MRRQVVRRGAVALAALEVASGRSDVVLAVGVDKAENWRVAPSQAGLGNYEAGTVVPFTHFALLAEDYRHRYGTTAEQVARVAVKNHANGARNPYAQRQKVRTLDEVLAAKPSADFDAAWGGGFMMPKDFLSVVYATL